MNEQDTEKDILQTGFALEDFRLDTISSAEMIKETANIAENAEENAEDAVLSEETLTVEHEDVENTEEAEEEDPIFAELAAPRLPELPKENRARLQMQSPTKLHFYWSIKNNPFQTLKRVFGNQTNSYTLVVKLVNQTRNREEIFPVEAEGSAWFDAEDDSKYKAEIGFYAPNRPFVRVMFSNELETPRKNPSPRRDYSPYFAVSANQFARVLDVSGYRQDAFEVALAGDDVESADIATQNAFAQITETPESDFDANRASEIRFMLLAMASGYALENLQGYISPGLFAFLQKNSEKLSAEKALAALQENFSAFNEEIFEEEMLAPTVFGASLINFPRALRRKTLSKFSPLSSFLLNKPAARS